MNYHTKELLFVSNLQTKLANNFSEISTRFNFKSDDFKENREISAVLDYFGNTRYSYVDENNQPSNLKKCNKTEDQLTRMIDYLRHRFRLGAIPYIDYPKRTTNVLYDLLCNGIQLPPGGGPGYYLTKDAVGNLKWERINDCLFKQTFVTGPVEQNLPPYTFILASSPEAIHQIFINGKLLENEDLYSLNDNILTIFPPVVLDNAVVSVFGGCASLNLLEIVGGYEDETIEWTEGNSFLANFNIAEILLITINGNKIKKSDYSFDRFTPNFTIFNQTFEPGDEIDIIYRSTQATEPVIESIFDFTFDETFD